jgi:quercetin dioxygenase-like cupin family protein
MARKIIICISFLAATLLAGTTLGEDAVKADPKHYTVEFENERIRVIRVKYGPGEKSVMHTHAPNLAVFLTDSSVRMTLPDGTTQDINTETGATLWAPDDEHLPENLGDETMEVILVELKE